MGNRNILQDFPSYMLSKEAPDIDEILNNYDDLKKKVQVLQNITTGVFQYQGSRSLKVLVDDIRAYLVNGGDNKYSKGCFYNINDLTGFSVAGLTVGDNIVFTGTIVTYSDESPVSYNPQTGMGNICGFEFDRFPSVVDLSEYLKTADADAKYALISDLENILKDIENNITQGGSIDSLTLDIPITDTSRINKMYNVVRGQWNGNINEAGGYHRFNYNCTMTNVKIINDNGSYYIQCNASDIPSEFYYRQYGNFTLNDGLSTFDITIGSYIYTFEYTSYSGTPLSEVLKFSLNNVQYGPKFSDDYYASKFVDNVYDLGDIAAVWAVDINVGDNFVITKNGFDPLVGNYATSGELSDLQNKLDTINKTLSGVYKNGGDVTEMTLDVPVSSSKINTMYNVKSGFVASGSYGEHGAFRYKITIKNAYILKTTSDSGNTYELCFKLGDIPSELWYYSIGMVTFYGKFQNAIDYQPSGVGWHFDFTSPSELSIQMPQEGLEYIVKLPYKTSYSGPTIDSYFSDKTFTDNKYQLGNIATIWYRNDISIDDNFVITEHGYDVLSYKITDYISKYQFDSLSATVAKKANSSDVYTKDEIRQKAFISETVSGYPVVIPKDEMLAGEQYTDFRIYGNADGFGTLNSSTNKYTINLTCRGKNLIYNLSANSYAGITPTKNDDGSVTLNGTATSIYAMARGRVSYLPPGTYHLSGCPQGGSEDTYCIKIGTLGVDTGEGATFTLDTAKSVIPIINVKKGTTLDNATFKPQIEIGEAATEFEKWGQKSDITITLGSALGENEYVDVINKKRYNSDGTVSNVTIEGELSIFDSDTNVIYCPMTTSPSKIEVSYYKDINTTLKAVQSDIDGKADTDDITKLTETIDKKQDKFAKRMFNNTTGKNYLDETTIKEGYHGGETSDWNVFYSDYTARSVVIELESGTYTMSAVADDTTVVFERYAINGTVTNIAGNHFTFTLTEASKVYITWHTQHHTYVNMKTMIELGNEATDYEPYIPVPGTGTTKFIAPEQFGAKGDNVTNDLDALNKCVQQAVKDHIAVRADGTYYIGSATLNLDVQGTDIYINRIRSTSTDCCVKLQGSNNTITINNVIASAGNGFVITTDESHLSSNSNYIFIKNISAKNHCFYKYSHDDTIRITYNTFNFLVLGSDSGDCIRDYGGGGNNIFNGNDVYCYAQQGHGIYVKGVAFSYYENFAFEQDVKYGVVCEDSCENTFNNMRTGELANEMRQNSNDRFVIKFVGNSYGNTFKSPMPYVAVKNEVNAFDAEAAQKQYQNTYFAECIRYNGINTVKMSVLQPYYYTQDDDGTKNWRAFSGTGDIVTYYNHTGIRLDYDVTHDIDVTEYTPYTTDDYIPTIFNIKTNTTITLNDMYFPFGISKITIVQSDDNKATVKDRHGNTIFDGSVRGNGKYELQCIVKENDTSTAFFVDCFCFTGENDEWIEVNDVYTKTEIDSAGYVKDTDYPKYENNTSYAGVVKISPDNGVTMAPGGFLRISQAGATEIGARSSLKPIIPANLNTAVKAALSDDKRISDMTDAEKANARDVIGANGKYDTIIDYTYTGEDAATELNILLTLEQLQKIKKYEKFFCYVTYNVSATTGTTSFWASATLNLCTKGTTTLLSYSGIFMRAANTVQKITADNTPITWIATTDKVRLPDSNVCITNVLDYGATQYNLFNISTLTGGSSRVMSPVLYQYSETNYDWVMQLKSPTAMPFVNGMKFIMWGK